MTGRSGHLCCTASGAAARRRMSGTDERMHLQTRHCLPEGGGGGGEVWWCAGRKFLNFFFKKKIMAPSPQSTEIPSSGGANTIMFIYTIHELPCDMPTRTLRRGRHECSGIADTITGVTLLSRNDRLRRIDAASFGDSVLMAACAAMRDTGIKRRARSWRSTAALGGLSPRLCDCIGSRSGSLCAFHTYASDDHGQVYV